MFQKTDVSKPADVKALVERAVTSSVAWTSPSTTPGWMGSKFRLHEQDIEKAALLFDVNIKGVFYCMKYEIEQMLKTGGGAIVNTSSIFGLNGYPGWCLYVASKHAVTGMTKAAALDYAKTEHPGQCGRPRSSRDAAAGERHGRRPAQLRRLRPDGADRPAGRDRRRRCVAAFRRGPLRHWPHAARRWWCLLAV